MLSLICAVAMIFAIAFVISTNRRAIRPRVIFAAFALQLALALLTLRLPQGVAAVQALAQGVKVVMGYSQAGTQLVFGDLAGPAIKNSFAIFVLPVVIFFASLIAVLYHLGVMQFIVRVIGGLLRQVLGTSRCESLCAAANIFVGQTESPLVIRPYIATATASQTFAIMTSGMAGVAGTILAAYALLGVRMDYLLAASIMSAPAGLMMAKIVMPETEGLDCDTAVVPTAERSGTLIMAASEGARTGLAIAAGLAAMLLAFSGLIALLNGLLSIAGGWFGASNLSFQEVLGWVFAGPMRLFGLSWREAQVAGGLLGEKVILNEFVAYVHFARIQATLTPYAQRVITFMLCGFANIGSIAVQLAVIGGIDPSKRDFVARFGLRALIAATLANLLNAAIAAIIAVN